MEIAEHIAALRHEGNLLAAAAAASDLDAPIPACPEWRLRDLLRHLGGVHRWATAHVAERRSRPMGDDEETAVMGQWPHADDALVDWFRAGHAALVHTLETAEPDLACWAFLSAPSPLAFWARRQAHETGMHRADVESARGPITPFPTTFSADGIDELLYGFASRRGGRLRADPPRTMQLHATDAQRGWLMHIGPDGVTVSDEHTEGDCTVGGCASDLYLLLWNRRSADGLDVRGDATLLDLWRRSMQVRWS